MSKSMSRMTPAGSNTFCPKMRVLHGRHLRLARVEQRDPEQRVIREAIESGSQVLLSARLSFIENEDREHAKLFQTTLRFPRQVVQTNAAFPCPLIASPEPAQAHPIPLRTGDSPPVLRPIDRGISCSVRLPDLLVLTLVVLQALLGLGAAIWRSTRRPRRGIDLTDLTGLSRSGFTRAHTAHRAGTLTRAGGFRTHERLSSRSFPRR